jgi:predicted MPP superfamily phosphohydrolase
METTAPQPRVNAGTVFLFARFFTMAFGLLAGVHVYFWWRLVHDTGMTAPWRGMATAALVALAVMLPVPILLRRAGSAAAAFAWPVYLWLGTLLLLLVALIGADVLGVALRVAGWFAGRELLGRPALETGAFVLAASAAAFSVAHARRIAVRRIEIPLARLPAALDGTVIVQLTDMHVGPTLGRAYVEDVVARTNLLSPDLVVITGDLADGDPEKLRDAVEPLARLSAKHGVFFVTGNHEYFGDAEGWLALLASLGVRALRNERVSIGDSNASFDLAGIDDDVGRRLPGHGPDLPRALAGRDATRELILLSHRPHILPEAAGHGVGLVLSGHTHGGQIWPFNHLVKLDSPYLSGLFRHGTTTLYVSEGTGYWGPPMRLGTTREITRIILRRSGVL